MPLASLELGAPPHPGSQTHHPTAHQEAREELPTLPGNLTPPEYRKQASPDPQTLPNSGGGEAGAPAPGGGGAGRPARPSAGI